MQTIALEDFYEDIIAKAQSGLKLADSTLSELSGVDIQKIRAARRGKFDEEVARKIAPFLQLNSENLINSAKKNWKPNPVQLEGLFLSNTNYPVPGYEEMTVNSYLCWNPKYKEAVLIDTGANIQEIIQKVKSDKLSIKALLITHSHLDHVADIDNFKKNYPRAKILSPFPSSQTSSEEWKETYIELAQGLQIHARITQGHAEDGTSWVIEGLDRQIAIVGDTLLAGSMGGAKFAWKKAHKDIKEQILSLEKDCILCPGHGPVTTVAEEKEHNPFFS